MCVYVSRRRARWILRGARVPEIRVMDIFWDWILTYANISEETKVILLPKWTRGELWEKTTYHTAQVSKLPNLNEGENILVKFTLLWLQIPAPKVAVQSLRRVKGSSSAAKKPTSSHFHWAKTQHTAHRVAETDELRGFKIIWPRVITDHFTINNNLHIPF